MVLNASIFLLGEEGEDASTTIRLITLTLSDQLLTGGLVFTFHQVIGVIVILLGDDRRRRKVDEAAGGEICFHLLFVFILLVLGLEWLLEGLLDLDRIFLAIT